MPTPEDLEQHFWKTLKSDMTMMVGLIDVEEAHSRPMTAQLKADSKSIWFFTSADTALATAAVSSVKAVATFTSKGHDIFATIHGHLGRDDDRATVDELWNPFVSAWFEGGKDDPKLVLLRFDPQRAELWEDASSIWSGIKLLLGVDPKAEYRKKTAEVRFSD